jgi:hypothetical protein
MYERGRFDDPKIADIENYNTLVEKDLTDLESLGYVTKQEIEKLKTDPELKKLDAEQLIFKNMAFCVE